VQEFQVLRVLGSALRIKAQAGSNSSRGQKDCINTEEKRRVVWGHARECGNWWFHGLG
jgi:hypothetical protein